jgi:hypothetical protein
MSPSLHLRTEKDPASETLCFLVLFRIPDYVQSPETQQFRVLHASVTILQILFKSIMLGWKTSTILVRNTLSRY